MQEICYVSSRSCKKCIKIIHVHQKCGKHHILTNSVMAHDCDNMNTRKVKRHRNSDIKNRQQRTTTQLPLGTVSNELLGGGGLTTYFTCTTSSPISEVVLNI